MVSNLVIFNQPSVLNTGGIFRHTSFAGLTRQDDTTTLDQDTSS